jgi:hypothetical protein
VADVDSARREVEKYPHLALDDDSDIARGKRAAERKYEEQYRRLQEGAPWTGLYFYNKAKDYLTNTHAELGLVAIILIVTIAPQLMNYILAGLSGCAATPRYVCQFEKIAIWSLIKFSAAFGGVFPTTSSWSPRCTNRRCTAGGLSTIATCA